MTILVLNAGSSSINFSTLAGLGEVLVPGAPGKVEAIAREELLERARGATGR